MCRKLASPPDFSKFCDNPLKVKMMKDLICYCFGYTDSDIERDFVANGKSTIMDRIAAEKKKGECLCASKNPKGR